ncbi:hypothetical protein GCM10026987_27710 [Belliella aquatica]|uniref:Uncharacterized protein n=1 Tax=Belliella aquatica TaxID=1323734 RepID=A0ABQ1N3I6_9BACT|nr:hypothetical protein GCM10010993_31080 [Belliella aquatica]
MHRSSTPRKQKNRVEVEKVIECTTYQVRCAKYQIENNTKPQVLFEQAECTWGLNKILDLNKKLIPISGINEFLICIFIEEYVFHIIFFVFYSKIGLKIKC